MRKILYETVIFRHIVTKYAKADRQQFHQELKMGK